MSIFNIDTFLGMILPILITAAKAIIDNFVKGEELNDDQRRLLVTVWVESHLWLNNIVDDTTNEYDNAALSALWEAIQQTANEAGFELPVIPENFQESL
jgi:ATP:corrinoid adenosyltransferase